MMKSSKMDVVSFGLALSPWLFVIPQALNIPGFG